jgi:mono/diheme cytochrome c family protein
MKSLMSVLLVALALVQATDSAAGAQNPTSAPAGNAERGKTLFEKTYQCYACHGYQGQTGLPRLVPQPRAQDAFIAYLRKPRSQAMPKYVDVPEQDLADVYAYVRSIKPDAASVESIPLLNDVVQRRAKTK